MELWFQDEARVGQVGRTGRVWFERPELNPIERVWLHLRERHLTHRIFETYDAILDACCAAWNALLADTGRIASLGGT